MLKRLLNTSSLKTNIIANFVGNGWSALISLLFVPLYLKYIGAEGYGLIGIFTSLQVVLSLLDSGLSTTLNKEIARLSALADMQQQMRNLVKTLGNVYWIVAISAGVIALGLSPLIANYWVHPKELSTSTVTNAFILLSTTIVFQFPSGFYTGGLLGLQRQVMINLLRIVFTTLKSVGALLILMFVSNSVLAFFGWNLGIAIIQAFTFRYALWAYLPQTNVKSVFDRVQLKSIWRFAAGLTVISLTGILLTQVDSVILSKILSLQQFGYYTLSYTIASVAYMIVGPVSQSYFPKFSVLLAEGKEDELRTIFHHGCQMVTLLVLPFSLFLAMFSKEIIFIWTHHNVVTTLNTWKITSVVTLAVAIHCLMFIPYMLCLTYSCTKLALYTNISILIVLVPSTIFSAIYYGGLGGATCWLIINLIYLLVNPSLVHRYILKGETFNWYWNDTFKPIIGCVILFVLIRICLLHYNFSNQTPLIVLLAVTGLVGFCLTILSSSIFRSALLTKAKFYFQKKTSI